MISLPKCKGITRIVLEGQERRLSLNERLIVRAHWLICKACTNFGKQVALMNKASRRWRNYSED
ncbi:anti-sigma factor family protein [Roseateles oligotrophus]|uniref:Zf-HC2 domain-containing protein n=1 Tax=Roseateles oligotrophus TaxID=1769250 RepID=A0ABT2YFH8_9BURK|nr:zf-HC2 domain-containing protein [Roseateles oligotrophus]MCV2368802.1 zf-HC2 domain-containing protein [Roseateles oligotrophus]